MIKLREKGCQGGVECIPLNPFDSLALLRCFGSRLPPAERLKVGGSAIFALESAAMRAARIAALAAVCVALAALAAAGDKKYANLRFTVIREGKKVPVRNASVILHPVNKDGE